MDIKRRPILLGIVIAVLLIAAVNGVKKAMEPEIVRGGVSRAHVAAPIVKGGQPGELMLATVSEYWRNDERQQTLTVFRMDFPFVMAVFSLTEDYMEAVEGPDPSVLAYISRDNQNWYQAYVLDSKKRDVEVTDVDTGEQKRAASILPIRAFETGKIKKDLRFSADGQFLSYAVKHKENPFVSRREYAEVKTGNFGGVDTWMETRGIDVEKLEWLPAKKPQKLPDFMTEKTPRIHEETVPVWSPDAEYLYVHDEEGIWKVNIYPERQHLWALYLPMKDVHAFQMSADGRYFLVEFGSEEEKKRKPEAFDARGEPVWQYGVNRKIALIDLQSKDKRPQPVGEGWGAVWSNQSGQFAYWSLDGLHIGRPGGKTRNIDDGKDRRLRISYNPMLAWSPDDSMIYARGDGGVWRLNVKTPGAAWENPCPSLRAGFVWAFNLSPDGRYLLIESDKANRFDGTTFTTVAKVASSWEEAFKSDSAPLANDDMRLLQPVILVDLEGGEGAAKHVGDGWGAAFDSTGKHFFFANFDGKYMGKVDSGEALYFSSTWIDGY